MSMSGDSCSTSSGCVSDLDNLSEDPSPDSPVSSIESSHSSTNSALNSLPNNLNEVLVTETIATTKEVEEVAEDELLEEELIESEIIIDCSLNDNSTPVVTENCYQLEIYNNDRNHCLSEFNSSDCSSSISSYKSETASIKSDTGSCLESDHKSSSSHPTLNGVFKEDSSSNSSSNSNSNNSSYFCKWTHCDWPGNYDDLVDHIREIHVELQPYQQQKHNWKEMTKSNSNKNKHIINRLNDRKITDNNNNNNNNLSNNNKKCDSQSQQYVCLWEGCKVYGKGSLSRNWLERHVLEQHSGPRPFKCIVEGCGARFKVQSALERHVNSHFKPNVDFSNNLNNCNNSSINCVEPSTSSNSQLMPSNCSSSESNNSLNQMTGLSPFELHLQQTSRATMMRCKSIDSNTNTNHFSNSYGNSINNCNTNGNNGTPNKILKRKKSATKLRRKCIIVKCSEDFFDECVMEQVRYGLIQLNAQTGLDISGTQSTITFHSKVIARRQNDSGEVNVLLKWEPNNILPDVWVSEPEASKMKIKTIPVSLLPHECLAQLIEINGESKPKIKQRRK